MICLECREEMVTSAIDCRSCYERGCEVCDFRGIEFETGCLSESCTSFLYGEEEDEWWKPK